MGYSPAAAPCRKARNPARDPGTIFVVFLRKSISQRRLFVDDYPKMKSEPNGRRICQEERIAKNERLAQYNRKYRHIHWVTNVAIQPSNHQVAGRRDRRRGSLAFLDEAGKGFQQYRHAADNQQPPCGQQDD